MKIPPLSSLPSIDQLGDTVSEKIPDNMKTMSVDLRHVLVITHAVPLQRALDRLPQLPQQLALDTLKVAGESCALLQTALFFNDNFRYTPLPVPTLDFWQLDFRVLVRRADAATRDPGCFVVKTLIGTRAAWALQRAVAGEATYADFNVITRSSAAHEHAAYIADVLLSDETPPTQFAVRATDDKPFASPFTSWTRMTDYLLVRPQVFSRFSVGDKTGTMTLERVSPNPIAAEFMPVGGEIREARFGVWEQLELLSPSEMRRPFSLLLQPEWPTTISSPGLL